MQINAQHLSKYFKYVLIVNFKHFLQIFGGGRFRNSDTNEQVIVAFYPFLTPSSLQILKTVES